MVYLGLGKLWDWGEFEGDQLVFVDYLGFFLDYFFDDDFFFDFDFFFYLDLNLGLLKLGLGFRLNKSWLFFYDHYIWLDRLCSGNLFLLGNNGGGWLNLFLDFISFFFRSCIFSSCISFGYICRGCICRGFFS